jgi:hypothetical protein
LTGILEGLLARHPWSERRLVEALFEPAALRGELQTAKITTLRTAGGQERWACRNEPQFTLLRLVRCDPARIYLLRGFGPHAVWQGQSPAGGADAEGFHRGRRILVFVDPDNIALEALDFLQYPPGDDGAARVVLAASSDRLRLILGWIERSWKGGAVIVDQAPSIRDWPSLNQVTFSPQTVNPRASRARKTPVENRSSLYDQKPTRGDTRVKNQLGKAWVQSGPSLQRRLTLAGNCPLFTFSEWMHLERDFERAGRKEWKAISCAGLLRSEGLGRDTRWMLSGLGLLALCYLWNVQPDVLQRYHPWPTRLRGRLEYSSRWRKLFGTHADLVRQLSLSFAEGGLRFSSTQSAPVLSAVLFGSRYRYLYSDLHGGSRSNFVAPDATLSVGWGKQPANRSFEKRFTFLLEVDRATHPLSRLASRLDRYATLWKKRGALGQLPVLLWVTEGAGRERFLVDEMRQRGIDGRACTFDRLKLERSDDWWLRHPLLGSELPYESTGGMCPWRPVWLSTTSSGLSFPVG